MAGVPKALTDYIAGRTGYDYNEHGKAGNEHTSFVPDEIVDRFCILGTPEQHVARLQELQRSASTSSRSTSSTDGKDSTLAAYGEQVIPAVAPSRPPARS